MREGTVCFIVKNSQVLLFQIQYPDGKLIWNGIGGFVKSGETPKMGLVREFKE